METIKTDRLILRKPQSSDKKQIKSILKDKSVKKYLAGLYCMGLSCCSFFLNSNFDYINQFCFVIENKTSKEIIGLIYSYTTRENILCTSYVIKENQRGNGYMPEAIKSFILYLIEHNHAAFIEFTINTDNISSLRVMEKLNIPVNVFVGNYSSYILSLREKPSF